MREIEQIHNKSVFERESVKFWFESILLLFQIIDLIRLHELVEF